MVNLREIMTAGWRAVAAALLLVVTAHAAAPFGQPLERRAGSAFSAATADVSLKNAAKIAVAKHLAPSPAPLPVHAIITAPKPAFSTQMVVPLDLRATGPPTGRITFSPLIARAPPAA